MPLAVLLKHDKNMSVILSCMNVFKTFNIRKRVARVWVGEQSVLTGSVKEVSSLTVEVTRSWVGF